ncbi:hypothetical protein COB72_04670 [bacterium]|nr:MAG: hypothetical protein COB72_04670 [bacterium]
MKWTTIAACGAAAIVAPTIHAGIATNVIDFGADFRDQTNGIILLDDAFDETFEQLGIRFSSPSANPIFWLGADYGFAAAANSIVMGDPRTGENSTHTLRVDFLTPVFLASIHGIDGGGDRDTLRIRAFTSDATQVDVDVMTSNFGSGGTVTVAADRIDYILIEQSGVNHGLFLDDLTYAQVPAPSTMALLGLGFLARRRRK